MKDPLIITEMCEIAMNWCQLFRNYYRSALCAQSWQTMHDWKL